MKDWEIKRAKNQLIISASQLSVFMTSCMRKWALKSVRKLPERATKATGIGTVVASCCERWLLADDNGYDQETGDPVEVFPSGWEVPENKFGSDMPHPPLTPAEQAMVKALIQTAVDQGTLQRVPGRVPEKSIWMHVCSHEGIDVILTGNVDLDAPGIIEDHKTVKTMKYALSPNKLREDIQLLTYAGANAKENNLDPDDTIWLSHNYFCKDPEKPRVEKRKADITAKRALDFWNNELVPAAKHMVEMRARYKTFMDAPHCKENYGEWKGCKAYGGCSYLGICHGTYSENAYEFNMAKDKKAAENNTPTKPNKNMSLSSLIKNKGNAAPASTTSAGTDLNPPAPANAGQPASASQSQSSGLSPNPGVPPWAVDGKGCKACQNNEFPGFDSEGVPCRVCLVRTKRLGVLLEHFDIVSEDGTVTWALKDEFIDSVPYYTEWIEAGGDIEGVLNLKAPTVTVKEKSAPPVPEKPLQEETSPAGETTAASEPAPESDKPSDDPLPASEETKAGTSEEDKAAEPKSGAKKTDKKKTGRPPASFKLMVGGSVCKFTNSKRGTGKGIVFGDDLVQAGIEYIMEELQDDSVESFYELDPFKRVDALKVWADTILVEKMRDDKDYIIFPVEPKGVSEIGAILGVLRQHAEFIFYGNA